VSAARGDPAENPGGLTPGVVHSGVLAAVALGIHEGADPALCG
jgi:hypothetical protein